MREKPINYSYLSVNAQGKICERKINGKSILDERIVEGYAVIWGEVNSHGERFVKGAFSKAIKDIGPASNSNYQIKFRDRHGKTCSLFEDIYEDEIGLFFRTKPLDNVSWADDVLTQLRSGSLNNFSIGFKHVWDKVEWDEENDCLVCLEVRLFEISVVDIPSDMSTYVIRSAEKEYVQEDVEEFIASLPKSKQLEARKLFSICITLQTEEQVDNKRSHSSQTSSQKKKAKKKVDLKFIIDNL
jgi:HK97 family phage prohead protease